MQMHFFAVPALDPRAAQDELNRFCAAQRVVSVERQFVAAGRDSYWVICVQVASGPGPLPDALKSPEHRTGARAACLVIPAQAGIQWPRRRRRYWAPACAGATGWGRLSLAESGDVRA